MIYYRKQVFQFQLEQSDHYKDLDLTTKNLINAIIKQQNIFQAMYNVQLMLMRNLHEETVSIIIDEIRVRSYFSLINMMLNHFSSDISRNNV